MNTGGGLFEGRGSREILTVTQLNRMVAGVLESRLPVCWVRGELSNLTRAASGHWYFTLKDSAAQVRAVMFRSRAQQVPFAAREGMLVEVSALPSLYQARGEFQLNIEAMRRAGDGDLFQQFLRLKERLQAEGLFDAGRKKALPPWPVSIGVVTSLQAAALRDVLTTLARRAPWVRVIIYPAPVQGVDAPAGLREALAHAARRAEVDLLLLVRGGGSIEDLWAFNDEALARAIAAMPMPVVSGVGHETDVTIADFVADLRAPTPTGAATLATVDRVELLERLRQLATQLRRAMQRQQDQRDQRIDVAVRLLRSPAEQWARRVAALQALAARWRIAQHHHLQRREASIDSLQRRLRPPSLEPARQRVRHLRDAFAQRARERLARESQTLDHLALRLQLASPDQLLLRGYAIVHDRAGQLVRSVDQADPGDSLRITLADGALDAQVSGRSGRPEAGGRKASGRESG